MSAKKKVAKAAPGRAARSGVGGGPRKGAARPKREAGSDYETVSWWEDFYRVVRLIPAGRVTTYGAVAAFGGHPRAARHVGYAMAALKDVGKNADVPWHRVLGAAPRDRARVSIKDPIGGSIQRGLLELEGVEFDALGRVSLAEHGWAGPSARGAAKAVKAKTVKVAPPAKATTRKGDAATTVKRAPPAEAPSRKSAAKKAPSRKSAAKRSAPAKGASRKTAGAKR